MGALTGKTIRPTRRGGGWAINDTPRAVELAQIDEQVSAYGLDSQGDDEITGTIALVQDPNQTVTPRITVTGPISVNSPGARVETTPAGGALSIGAPAQFSTPRTRTVRWSMLESCRSYAGASGANLTSGNALRIAGGGIGLQTAAAFTSGGSAIWCTIPKPHDGATLLSLSAFFFVPSLPASVPGRMPTLRVARITLATGASAWLYTGVSQSFATPASPAAWYANGKPQKFTFTPNENATVDIQHCIYQILLQDVTSGTGGATNTNPIWTGFEAVYEYADERFTQ